VSSDQLVSVVIPAYNAEVTLDETLRSVRAQTHSTLEIIVVDDGSTDNTRMVADRHAEVDNRVQVVTQDHAGVAAARNRGWSGAQSDLIAFLDADDLWAPTKIELQIQALQAGGRQVGLVYCWFTRIDGQGSVISVRDGAPFEGDVLDRILVGNFVGNGSMALVRRQALIDANGFESGLRANGAEGCEDFLFYCRVAERYHYALVPERLVGYRYLAHNMSSDHPRMLRSWMLVVDEMLARHPDRRDALKIGLRGYAGWIVRDALSTNKLRELPPLLRVLLRRYPSIALKVLLKDVTLTAIVRVRDRLRRLSRGIAKPTKAERDQRFLIGDLD